MKTFDSPMTSIETEQLFGTGAVRRMAGQAVNEVVGLFAGFFVKGVTLEGKDLADEREIEVVV